MKKQRKILEEEAFSMGCWMDGCRCSGMMFMKDAFAASGRTENDISKKLPAPPVDPNRGLGSSGASHSQSVPLCLVTGGMW
jgi:hypothetical protein